MRTLIKILITIILLNIVFVGLVHSQDYEKIYVDFRRLELYMAKIWEIVEQFGDSKAIGYMALAKSEIDKARNYLFNDNPRLGLAAIHMAKARQLTNTAARLVLSKPFLNLKSQLDDLINRAENAVSNSNSDEAHYLLNQAKKFRRLAYASFNQRRLKRGEEYYRISFFFAKKCLDYLQSGGMNLIEQFENLKFSVQQLINQAQELLVDNEQQNLRNLVREAEKHFEEAVTLKEEGRLQLAISRLRLIKRLLYRVIDQAEKGFLSDEGRLENSFYTQRSLLEALEREVENSPNQRSQALLNKAWQFYKDAEQEFENGNYAKSQGKISISQRLANKLFRITRSRQDMDRNELEDLLRETQNLLQLQQDRVSQSSNKNIINLYQEASRMLERAQQALSSNRLGIAYQLIQAATRMSARIQREMRASSKNIDLAALERKYFQIINAISNLENNEDVQSKFGSVLNQLKQFAEKGKNYLDEGKYLLADEYFSTAWEQINHYTNKWRR